MQIVPQFGRTLVLVLGMGFLMGTIPVLGQEQEEQSSVEDPDAIVYVDGLACPFCAYGLEKKLDDLDAIEAMEVQVEESRILVAFREGQRASEKELRQAVEKAGFSARKIEFPNEKPKRSR